MKPKSPGSSSDLDRARALAARLAEDAPANAPDVPPPPGGYIVFSAARFTGGAARGPAPAAHRETHAPPPAAPKLEPVRPAPEPVRPAPEPHRPAPSRPPADLIVEAPPPPPRPTPPPRPETRAEAPRPAPPPPPRAEPEPEPPPAPDAFEPSPAFEAPQEFAPAWESAPAFESEGPGIEEPQEVPQEEEIAAPSFEAVEDEAAAEPPPTPPATELEEENLGVLPEDGEEAPAAEPPPSWAQILDDCLYLARARSALVMDRGGRVVEARGEWPKNTLEKIAVRLKSAIDKAVASSTGTETSVLVELQLGAFWLTGIRVVVADSPAVAGFLAQAPLRAEVRPALEGELSRGQPL